jgi:hypothetical protein
MSNKELQNRDETLISKDQALVAVFHKNGRENGIYYRKNAEELFSQYARVITGAPGSGINTVITREDFAIVLLLREIMHHLRFDSINTED